MQKKNKNVLSIANFKDADGNDVDIDSLNDEEFIQYHLAHLMNSVIKVLEMAVPAERNFSSAKYAIMKSFHTTLENIVDKK